jgi:hypothetical protein
VRRSRYPAIETLADVQPESGQSADPPSPAWFTDSERVANCVSGSRPGPRQPSPVRGQDSHGDRWRRPPQQCTRDRGSTPPPSRLLAQRVTRTRASQIPGRRPRLFGLRSGRKSGGSYEGPQPEVVGRLRKLPVAARPWSAGKACDNRRRRAALPGPTHRHRRYVPTPRLQSRTGWHLPGRLRLGRYSEQARLRRRGAGGRTPSLGGSKPRSLVPILTQEIGSPHLVEA